MLIAVRELKTHLSSMLARAQRGEVIEVTSHNKPIARIIGIPSHKDHLLWELVADASVTWNGKKPAFPEHLPKLSAGGKPLSTIIQEGRAGFYFATPLRLQSFSSTKSTADKCLKQLNKRLPCRYAKSPGRK